MAQREWIFSEETGKGHMVKIITSGPTKYNAQTLQHNDTAKHLRAQQGLLWSTMVYSTLIHCTSQVVVTNRKSLHQIIHRGCYSGKRDFDFSKCWRVAIDFNLLLNLKVYFEGLHVPYLRLTSDTNSSLLITTYRRTWQYTMSAPYSNASSLVGRVPILTMGARITLLA